MGKTRMHIASFRGKEMAKKTETHFIHANQEPTLS